MSVSASNVDEKREHFFCKRVPPRTGCFALDKAKLAAVVKAEGLSFVDATDVDPKADPQMDRRDFSKPIVFLLNWSQCQLYSHCTNPEVIGHLLRAEDPELHRCKTTKIEVSTSRLRLARWLREDDEAECIVCYKTAMNDSLENIGIQCICGTVVCFGCHMDLLMIAPTEMTTDCPNCKHEVGPNKNLFMLFKIMCERLPLLTQIDGSEEHLDFIEKMTSVDLTLSHERATAQAKRMFRDCAEISRRKWIPDTLVRVYTAQREFIESKRKKKVVSASADVSHSSGLVARRGCANCGKQFWDKSDWRRAPKCTKCQRTAYCSAKCRKKHTKRHTAECSSVKGAKQKKRHKKKKRKKKKDGCAPY